uniref:Condensation domain-containing protein n=1 Tax=Candidatus Kentrum sp. LPFa TaxID=2126335 RepID=A0A450WFF7_9GAMM|nr:MAG: Condensation domain-containing protein [Candidatus Kentron sp. LPFa]VFK31506.1 MAG: Condensation domain-containing protein [Candidatus Kentron sp. LPFa]
MPAIRLGRTTFSERDGVPFQIVHEGPFVDYREILIKDGGEADLEEILDAQVSQRPIDLEQGPPVRWVLVSIKRQQPVLLFIAHHIISDGWSIITAITELGKLYREETGGPPANLPLPKETYSRFIQEQSGWLASQGGERERLFWREALSGHIPLLNLPTNRPRPANPSFRTDTLPFAIPLSLQKEMRKLAKDMKVRPLALWLSAWFVFLHRLTGQQDLVTTIPGLGRSRKYFSVLGFFVNAIAIRARCSGTDTFRAFLTQVTGTLDIALTHKNFPLSLMFQSVDRGTSSSLAQTSFAWQNL